MIFRNYITLMKIIANQLESLALGTCSGKFNCFQAKPREELMARRKDTSDSTRSIATLLSDFAQGAQTTAPQNISQQAVASSEVYRKLRSDLLNCHFLPGQKLPFEVLRERYSVGMGTLREALSHLVADGLVRTEAGLGFRASPVSVADMLDIAEWRVEFETKAVKDAILNGDDIWEAAIVSSYHLMVKATPPTPESDATAWEEWTQRHQRFHEALVSACRSPWLLHFRALLFDQAQRYRRLAFLHNPRPRHKGEEHGQIMDAVIKRDTERATSLVEQHVRQTVDTALRNVPDLAVLKTKLKACS